MAEQTRPSLDAETLGVLARAAGLPLTADETSALLPPVAAIYAAIDRLDELDLADIEPPYIFRLRAE